METSIGSRIKALRKSLGLTQAEFAERVGLSGSGLSNYEIGRSTPLAPIIKSLCDVYGVREQWLRTGEGQMMSDKPKEDAIESFLASVMSSEPDSIRRRMVSVLSKLSEEQWKAVAEIADMLVEETEKRKGLTEEEIWEQEGEKMKQDYIAQKRAAAKSSASPFTGSNTA